MGFEPKKLALLRILQILQEDTDADHPLTQAEIAEILNNRYGIVIERKAIGYNLSLLKEAGYEIESGRAGSFLAEREFDDMEIRVLIDAVLNSRSITESYSKDLIKRLAKLSGKHFRPSVGHIRVTQKRFKTDNKQVYRNIELIDEAIEKGCQISYDYNQVVFPLAPRRKAELIIKPFRRECVSPHGLILHDQQYYLKGYRKEPHCGYEVTENLKNITNLNVLETKPAIPIESVEQEQTDPRSQFVLLPLLSYRSGENRKTRFELLMPAYAVDEFCDRFGTDCTIARIEEEGPFRSCAKIGVVASEESILQWVMLFQEDVLILSPKNVRERFCRMLQGTLETYKKL